MMTLRQNFIAGLGVLVFALGVLTANEAAAQTVSLRPVAQQLSEALIVLVGGFVTFIAGQVSLWLGKKLKLDNLKIDEQVRAYLLEATKRAISWAMLQLEARDLLDIDVKNKVVALAVQYLVDRVPDALKQLGLTEDKLKGFVEARIGPFDLSAPAAVLMPVGGLSMAGDISVAGGAIASSATKTPPSELKKSAKA